MIRIFFISLIGFQISSAQACEKYIRHTWMLNIQKKTVQRISKVDHAEEICKFPESGQENALIEIQKGGKTVFKRKISISTTQYFDVINNQKELSGGKVKAVESVVVTHVPEELTRSKNVTVVFSNLSGHALIAQGDL